MQRKFKEYGLDKFKREFPELANSSVRVFYDNEDEKMLGMLVNEILKPNLKKFRRILAVILKNEYHNDLYKREAENVTAMKFIGKQSRNARIYCKEIFAEGKKVVMITPYFKKTQRNQDDHAIMQIIETIKTYEYEI
jgi:hypothetical protein